MKLKNKKTGKVGHLWYSAGGQLVVTPEEPRNNYYDSLAELCAEWEDL